MSWEMTMRNGDWIQTYTGRQFFPIDPRAEDIDVHDIAHALSLQCRYSGHCLRFYSVAEHCCHISDHCSPETALWGLLHDASEAYLVDVPRPIKPDLANYRELEDRLMNCIAERFGLPMDMPEEVKSLDGRILVNEREQVMSAPPARGADIDERIHGLVIWGWTPVRAEMEFLARFYHLTRGGLRDHRY